jgi:glycosyltransferase involved in cell wall biosynthesis
MKVLTLVQAGQGRPGKKDIIALENADKYPRTTIYSETLNSDILDEEFLKKIPAWRKLFYKLITIRLTQLIEAFIIRNRYDLIISWTDNLGLMFAFLLKLTKSNTPLVSILCWISKPKQAKLLSKVHKYIDRMVIPSSYQRDYAIKKLGVPESKVISSHWFVDQKFYRPKNVPTDMISSAGREMRDYSTLIKAMEGLNIPCHIAASYVKGRNDLWKDDFKNLDDLPSNITIGSKSFTELRDMYARSRFVVVPILASSDSDNGVSVIMEAMAMGKAVICSKTKAQVDIVQQGINGIFVTPGNPDELRKAIKYLWEHPEEAERMGKAGRRHIEMYHSIERFVLQVRNVAEEVLEEKRILRQSFKRLPAIEKTNS